MSGPRRWLVLPGLACPASSFDAVRAELHRLRAPVELHVLDAWRDPFLEADPGTVLAGRSYVGVVGHSLGGLLALQAALEHPAQTGRLLLLDPTPPSERGPGPLSRRVLRELVPRAIGAAGALGVVRGAGPLVDRWWRLAPAPAAPSFASTAVWQRIWREDVAGWDRARHVGRALETGRPAVPVTHLVATRAGRRERDAQTALARRLGTRAVPVPACGHLVMRDRPDVVAAAVARSC